MRIRAAEYMTTSNNILDVNQPPKSDSTLEDSIKLLSELHPDSPLTARLRAGLEKYMETRTASVAYVVSIDEAHLINTIDNLDNQTL